MPPQLKPAHLRANRNKPTHGEYQTLAALARPVLPPLTDFGPAPAPLLGSHTGKWPRRTLAVWNAWRDHPITQEWSAAEVTQALDTIVLHAIDQVGKAGEIRIRMDDLGLTAKGLRTRRRLLPDEALPEVEPTKLAPVRTLPEAK